MSLWLWSPWLVSKRLLGRNKSTVNHSVASTLTAAGLHWSNSMHASQPTHTTQQTGGNNRWVWGHRRMTQISYFSPQVIYSRRSWTTAVGVKLRTTILINQNLNCRDDCRMVQLKRHLPMKPQLPSADLVSTLSPHDKLGWRMERTHQQRCETT